MAKRILVTLDGSVAAERALEPAVQLAKKFNAELLLLRVVPIEELAGPITGTTSLYYDLRDLNLRRACDEAEAYLRGVRSLWRNAGLPIRIEVICGAPPEMIQSVAKKTGVDLIVMATHGRSGLRRFLYGSVAEAVLRGANLPVLLVPLRG